MSHSIVEYLSGNDGYRCGYCGSSDSNYSHGMWAHTMTCQDYQDLIDRGWRRSGKYVYKPTMDKMCCPLYTIRCHAPSFKVSKSQKKVLKRATKFFTTGEKGGGGPERGGEKGAGFDAKEESEDSPEGRDQAPTPSRLPQMSLEDLQNAEGKVDLRSEDDSAKVKGEEKTLLAAEEKTDIPEGGANATSTAVEENSLVNLQKKVPKPGLGPDPTRPPCKKAKQRRLEKRQEKLAKGLDPAGQEPSQPSTSARSKVNNDAKSLEELIIDSIPGQEPKYKLEIKLVRSSPMSSEFRRTFEESYAVYKKYQMCVHNDAETKCTSKQIKLVRTNPPSPEYIATEEESHRVYAKYQMCIHNDPPHECTLLDYKRFLVDSPLEEDHSKDSPECGYGSFHQHYIVDGKIIAVGVIDILPHCMSSVYFYYDPDYRFLTLGTFSALRELAFTRLLHVTAPSLQYYYMGFYVHSCPKMRYKGQYHPSFLLCPEVFTFHPIEECVPKLELSQYSRFSPPDAADAPINLDEVLILHRQMPMTYEVYKQVRPQASDDDEVKEYSKLAGKKCYRKMLLFRS